MSWGLFWVQSKQYLHDWVQIITNGIRINPQTWCGGLFDLLGGVCLLVP